MRTQLKQKMLEYIVTEDASQRLMLLLQIISIAAAMTPQQLKKEFPLDPDRGGTEEPSITMNQQMPMGENIKDVFNEYARHHKLFYRFLELYHLHIRALETVRFK